MAADAGRPRDLRDRQAPQKQILQMLTKSSWDIFISHASEDKEAARILSERLSAQGLNVWLDDSELVLGDSLQRSIDNGLAHCRFGVVILSPAFFEKHWPQKELAALAAREVGGKKVILPIWHELSQDDVLRHSPTLADRYAVESIRGWAHVAREILRAVGPLQRWARFRPYSERTQICYHLEFLELWANNESASIHAHFKKDSAKQFSEQLAIEFIERIWTPAKLVLARLVGVDDSLLVAGRTFVSNPTYSGHEDAFCFDLPIIGIRMEPEESELYAELGLRGNYSGRDIDYGFLDLLVREEPNEGPSNAIEERLTGLRESLAIPLGQIAALALNAPKGKVLMLTPEWGAIQAIGVEAYLLKGVLR